MRPFKTNYSRLFRSYLYLSFITGLLPLLGTELPAEWQTDEGSIVTSETSVKAVLFFFPEPAPRRDYKRDTLTEMVPLLTEEHESRRESTLLAVPFVPDMRTVRAKWEDMEPSKSDKRPRGLEIKAVQLGPENALQVIADPTELEVWKSGKKSWRLAVSVSALPDSKDSRSRQTVIGGSGPLDSLFLNKRVLIERQISNRKLSQATPPSPPGDWKISVSDGPRLMRVSPGDLPISSVSSDHYFSYYGQPTPAEPDGADYLIYMPDADSLYTRDTAVFLDSSASGSSPGWSTRPAFPNLSPCACEEEQVRRLRVEENLRYVRLMNDQPGEKFVALWLVYPPASGLPQSGSISVPVSDVLTTRTVEVGLQLEGLTQWPLTNPDHHADITVEGVSVPRIEWEGKTRYATNLSLMVPSLDVGGAIDITHTVADDSPTVADALDSQMLDWVEASWTGLARAEGGQVGWLSVPLGYSGPRRVSMGGFPAGTTSNDLVVLDVTDPTSPVLVLNAPVFTDQSGTVGVEFEVAQSGGEFLIQRKDSIAAPDAIVTPESLDPITDPNFELHRIYVRPEEFASTLQPLVDDRGAGTVILDPQAAYDTFGGGQRSPEAIREALRFYVTNAPSRVAIPEMVLFGYSSFDPKDYTGNVTSPILPFFFKNGNPTSVGTLEHSVDFDYALIEGDDDIPDAVVTRIPAKTTTELGNAITRQLAYEALEGTLTDSSRGALFIADNDSDFQFDMTEWVNDWAPTGRPPTRVDLTSSDATAVRTAVFSAWESGVGQAFTLYVGHGNQVVWSASTILSLGDIDTLAMGDKWPLVATFTCLNGYYAFPGANPCLAQGWILTTPDHGAIANIAPVGADFYFEQREFTRSFMKQFDTTGVPPLTAGEAFFKAQVDFATRLPDKDTTVREFLYFGDPATPFYWDPDASVPAEFWRTQE